MKAAIILLALALSGCIHTTAEKRADGSFKFSRTAILSKQSIGHVEASGEKVVIEGYKTDQSEAASTAIGAAAAIAK